MRSYCVVSPKFWTGETGKAIKNMGRDEQVVAMYLITSPHANMIGLYYLPLPFLSHETGIPLEGASKALRRVSEGGFCTYDEVSEVVFVHEMAAFQAGQSLKPKDNRVKSIISAFDSVPKTPLKALWVKRYSDSYGLAEAGFDTSPFEAPSQAPSKPLRSQEQEQEQEQDSSTPPVAPLADADPDPTPTKGPPAIGIDRYLAECEEAGRKPIPPVGEVMTLADKIDLPRDLLHLAWMAFVARQRTNSKRQKDWPKAFANCLRGNWLKLWYRDGDQWLLTTAGEQAALEHPGIVNPDRKRKSTTARKATDAATQADEADREFQQAMGG